MSTVEPTVAEESLKRLHQIVDAIAPPEKVARSLRPRSEPQQRLVEASLPPQRNRQLRGRSPTFFLSRGAESSQLLKRAAWLKQLNQRVMGKLGLPYSAHLHLSTITPNGVAVVHADSPAWVQKGRFLQKNLLDLLQMEGAPEVRQVKLKVRFTHSPATTQPKTAIRPPRQIAERLSASSGDSSGPLGRALKRLSTTLLRNHKR
jgi:hypothetical protein